MFYDLVVRDGKIVDGTGSPWYRADLGIKDGKIFEVGKIEDPGEKTLDVHELVVSPGWIDIHMHADHTIMGNMRAESYIHQGVTTVTVGNCGLSVYPLYPRYRSELISYLKPFTSGLDLKWEWETMGDFLSILEGKGIGLNIVPFIGHGSLRINVMGFQDRAPSSKELEEMKNLLEEAMKQGAYGMSTGLGYPPGVFSEDDELAELCHVLSRHGGIYSTHMREKIDNLKETIELCFKAKVPVEVSHIGSSCASYKPYTGRHRETTLKAIDDARKEGLDITADIYPYTAGSSLLSQVIPDWAHEGGVEKMLKRLRDPETRIRLKKEYMEKGSEDKARDFDKVYVTYVKTASNKRFEGMNIAEIAEARGQPVVEALCDLLIEENAEAMNVTFWGTEDDVSTLVRHPAVMPCSDGWVHAPYGELSQGKPHPRCYGAFPRYLRKYYREQQLFTLEEAIRRMTGMPASRLGLQDRGIIRRGMIADLVIFDPVRVRDKATFDEPHQYPEGIPYVIVNGEITIDGGKHTGVLNGKVLRKR